MKIGIFSIILYLLVLNSVKAQNILPEKWAKHIVDSLHIQHVDTIIYYNERCSECDVRTNDTACLIKHDGITEISNMILYQQQGKYYILADECKYGTFKREIKHCKSISYFASVIPTLNQRDKAIKAIFKQHHFLRPIPTDGVSESATIYCYSVKQNVNRRLNLPEEYYKTRRHYFWIDREIQIMKLIHQDLAVY